MPTLNGNLYRCRARNAFGQVFSNPAKLAVTNGYTWTPPPLSPQPTPPGFIFSDNDNYIAEYVNPPTGGAAGFTSSLIGSAFQTILSFDTNLYVGKAFDSEAAFSVYFASAGVKPFSWDVAGAFIPAATDNFIVLRSLDGSTLLDSDDNSADGSFSTTFHLNVPAPGQYLVLGRVLRTTPVPGSIATLTVGYTLGAGDQIATTV